jgi:hypothetical protein
MKFADNLPKKTFRMLALTILINSGVFKPNKVMKLKEQLAKERFGY